MTPHFEFVSTDGTGQAARGRIESSAGSLVNRAQLWLGMDWQGSVKQGDDITISITVVDALLEMFRVELFIGIVSKVRPAGDLILIECVTHSAWLLLADAPVKAWVNAPVASVVKDLVGSTRLDASTLWIPPTFESSILHSWHTDGGVVAHELTELLFSVAPGVIPCAMPDGSLSIGTRADLAQQLSVLTFPTDASINPEGAPEFTRTQFSLRPAYAHQAVVAPADGEFLGTIDAVVHHISMGQAYTEIILDKTPDAAVAAYAAAGA